MKTIIFYSTLIFTVSSTFMSCKKDYTCSCSKTYTGSDGSTYTTPDGVYTYNDTHLRASDRCLDQEGEGRDLSGEYTRDCELKW